MFDAMQGLDGTAYMHNSSLQPFGQDYDLVSHTTYVVCVNFYTGEVVPTV